MYIPIINYSSETLIFGKGMILGYCSEAYVHEREVSNEARTTDAQNQQEKVQMTHGVSTKQIKWKKVKKEKK